MPLVVASQGAVLAAAPPGRPSQPVPGVFHRIDDQRAEERDDFVAGQRDLTGWRRAAGVLGSGGDGEERKGQHGQGGPPVPGAPPADLVVVQPGQALGSLEILFNRPLLIPVK